MILIIRIFFRKTAICTNIVVGAILLTISWIFHFFNVPNSPTLSSVHCQTVKHIWTTVIKQLFDYVHNSLTFIQHFQGWTSTLVEHEWNHHAGVQTLQHMLLSQAWYPFLRPVWVCDMEMILIVTCMKCEYFVQVVWIESIETLAVLRVYLMTNWLTV